MRLLLIGYNDAALAALDSCRPAGSVTLIEEKDLWEAKGLAPRAAKHACLGPVEFARYQQDDQFLSVVAGLGPFDAVAAGLEYAVLAAAQAAELLGLPGPGVGAATVLRDKLLLRETTSAAGMAGPAFQEIRSAADIARFAQGGPCVVKPAGRQASLGVLLLDAGADVQEAWRYCSQADEGRQLANRPMEWRYLAEERMHGPEFSTEALVRDGKVLFCNVTRKHTLPGPQPVEIGHTIGVQDDPVWRQETERLIAAVGFGSGILHAEWVRTGTGPQLIECAARPPGDRILELVDLAYGINVHDRWIGMLLGEPGDLPSLPGRAAAVRFVTGPGPGVVEAVGGVEEARSAPGVARVEISRHAGDVIEDVRSSWDRLGLVIATGGTAGEAQSRARDAAERVTVTLRPQDV
ncbi:ATP-grasp domain-containing protein [Streptomyces sp. NPDC017056]|uniref:ATP-grasp domain-containing protein n=1 Tax=Streptomyces sp. NPDC017056 TaxID=3364973 RepID=UPI0037A05A03